METFIKYNTESRLNIKGIFLKYMGKIDLILLNKKNACLIYLYRDLNSAFQFVRIRIQH